MKWKVLNNVKVSKDEEIIDILLENRGLKTKKEKEEFLSPTDPEKFTASDLGISDREIKQAVKRIKDRKV